MPTFLEKARNFVRARPAHFDRSRKVKGHDQALQFMSDKTIQRASRSEYWRQCRVNTEDINTVNRTDVVVRSDRRS